MHAKFLRKQLQVELQRLPNMADWIADMVFNDDALEGLSSLLAKRVQNGLAVGDTPRKLKELCETVGVPYRGPEVRK